MSSGEAHTAGQCWWPMCCGITDDDTIDAAIFNNIRDVYEL
jgi:hypothetical protein